MISCAAMAEILDAAALTARAELAVPTEELMVLLEAEAKHFIGHYQEGWDPLAPSTIKEKTDLGYARPTIRCCAKGTCGIRSSTDLQ